MPYARYKILGRPQNGVVSVDWAAPNNRGRRTWVWVTLPDGSQIKTMKCALRPAVSGMREAGGMREAPPREFLGRDRFVEIERGRKWVRSLDRQALGDLGDAFVDGTFDWREWLRSKPSALFLRGADEERIRREEAQD